MSILVLNSGSTSLKYKLFSKDSLRVLYQNYPKLWDKLKKYEKDSPQGFKPNFKLNEIEKKWANQTKLK